MTMNTPPQVAIVDFGLGNLFSVRQACATVGLQAEITSARRTILDADAVILPGVGAFGDAMAALHRLDMVNVLRDVAASDKPLIGICLGMQLMMRESLEFGHHDGLGIIPGTVVRFDHPRQGSRELKVPQIGWNRVWHPDPAVDWDGTLLTGIPDGEFMYFVHSYVVQPEDSSVVLSASHYGQVKFCSSLRKGNIFACQFHPERSGYWGVKMYQNLAALLDRPASIN